MCVWAYVPVWNLLPFRIAGGCTSRYLKVTLVESGDLQLHVYTVY